MTDPSTATSTSPAPGIQLGFGWHQGLVPGIKAAWGARAICTQDGTVDLVPDRTDTDGDPALVRATLDWLNSSCGDLDNRGASTTLGRALAVARAMLKSHHLDTRKRGGAVIHQDRTGAVICDTNASAGYLYISAYLFEALPDGYPTKGLDVALRLKESF